MYPPKNLKQRTLQQNAALHKYFELVAERLNNLGYDLKQVLAQAPVDIPCTPYNIKEMLFKPILKAQLGLDSTTKMSTKDIDPIFDTVNRFLAEKFGISEPFPSIDEIIFKLRDF